MTSPTFSFYRVSSIAFSFYLSLFYQINLFHNVHKASFPLYYLSPFFYSSVSSLVFTSLIPTSPVLLPPAHHPPSPPSTPPSVALHPSPPPRSLAPTSSTKKLWWRASSLPPLFHPYHYITPPVHPFIPAFVLCLVYCEHRIVSLH